MKVLSVHAENFGSYDSLDFTLDASGLILIQGSTGSGKSTLCDVVPWALFGRTAKNGLADEVMSWPGDKQTMATVVTDIISVTRIRGKGNDLFWTENGVINRGKDIPDTQRRVNQKLNLNVDLYLSGSYFHEFSQTAQFFTTSAKNRRTICEQLVDLSLAKILQEKTSLELKSKTEKLNKTTSVLIKLNGDLSILKRLEQAEVTKNESWWASQTHKMNNLKDRLNRFEVDKQLTLDILNKKYYDDLKQLRTSIVCTECGSPKAVDPNADSPYRERIEAEQSKSNPYIEQLRALEDETNPHSDSVKDFTNEISHIGSSISINTRKLDEITQSISDLETLTDIIVEFRSVLIYTTISRLETTTNDYLEKYFDAEIRTTLDIQDTDKLEVSITKDGNFCAYTQLSKGQRQVLKLCFGVAVMEEVSNHSGVDFNTLWFDESTDGMDDSFKMKSLRLLESLSLSDKRVFLVEHSEQIKTFINTKYSVTLVNGRSQIAVA